MQDITKRKKDEKKLLRQSKAIEASMDGVAILDADGEYIFMNEAHADIYGFDSPAELMGETWIQLYREEELEYFKKEVFPELERKGEWRGETVGKRKDGSLFHQEISLSNVEADGLVCICRDITERKNKENALKKEKLRFQLATKSTSDVIWDWDFSENKIWWSDGLRAVFGYKDYEVASDPDWWEKQVHPEDRERAEKSIIDFLASDRTYWALSYKFCHADGSLSYVEETGYVVRNEEGRPVRMIGAMSDITDEKKSKIRIEESLEEKKVLLAEVHHRVKNNLAIISGLLKMQTMNEEDEHFSGLIQKSQLRIQSMAMVHEMLYQSTTFSTIGIKEYVQKLADVISKTLKPADKEIKTVVESEDVTLSINQAIPCAMNISEIIANAYEHAFEGRQEGKITIEISQEGDTIGITVTDNGIGLPDEFEEMRKDSLGITLIKTLCKQLQSEIEIESGDWGTRFSFAFQKRAVSGSSSLKKV